MAKTKTTVLITDNRISHALMINHESAKVTACKMAFVAWIEDKKKRGPWLGVDESLPTVRAGEVDCMTCIVKATPS